MQISDEMVEKAMTAAGDAVQDYACKMVAAGGAIDAADYALRAVIYRAMIDVGTKDAQS